MTFVYFVDNFTIQVWGKIPTTKLLKCGHASQSDIAPPMQNLKYQKRKNKCHQTLSVFKLNLGGIKAAI